MSMIMQGKINNCRNPCVSLPTYLSSSPSLFSALALFYLYVLLVSLSPHCKLTCVVKSGYDEGTPKEYRES